MSSDAHWAIAEAVSAVVGQAKEIDKTLVDTLGVSDEILAALDRAALEVRRQTIANLAIRLRDTSDSWEEAVSMAGAIYRNIEPEAAP